MPLCFGVLKVLPQLDEDGMILNVERRIRFWFFLNYGAGTTRVRGQSLLSLKFDDFNGKLVS